MRVLFGLLAIAAGMFAVMGCGGGGGSSSVTPPASSTSLYGYVYTDTQDDGPHLLISGEPRADLTPVKDALVTLIEYSGKIVYTSSAGYFKFTSVPTGPCTLVVEGNGLAKTSRAITLVQGNNPVSLDAAIRTVAEWAVLVYMCADNDLERYGIDDINEMERAVSQTSDAVKVLVQLDRSGKYDSSNAGMLGARRLEIAADKSSDRIIRSASVQVLGADFDMGDWQNLKSFISWGQQAYPAKHYMVVIWNHGSGWDPFDDMPQLPVGAIAYDYGSWNWIRDGELPQALDVPSRVDVLAMDACLMGMLEIAYELRQHTDYMVVSVEPEPVEGYNYSTALERMVATADTATPMTPREVAQYVPLRAIESWPYVDVTCSAFDMAKISTVADAADALADALIVAPASNIPAIKAAANSVLRYDADVIADLGDYATRLASGTTDPGIVSAASALKSAISDAVVANYYHTVTPSTGMSIYLPKQGDFGTFEQQSYGYLDFHAFSWDEWLTAQP